MEGRMRPYLPELTIRDYNTYLWYLRGVRWQMRRSYGFYSCRLLQYNGVLFALLADSLAGRSATCVNQRLPGTLCYRQMMCQTQGIRLAAQVEVMMGWHKLQDRRWDELPLRSQLFRAVDHALLRRAYESEYRAEFTDDASVVEAVGQAVCLAEGERENLKLTTPGDFVIAEALIAAREEAENEEGTTDAEHV